MSAGADAESATPEVVDKPDETCEFIAICDCLGKRLCLNLLSSIHRPCKLIFGPGRGYFGYWVFRNEEKNGKTVLGI